LNITRDGELHKRSREAEILTAAMVISVVQDFIVLAYHRYEESILELWASNPNKAAISKHQISAPLSRPNSAASTEGASYSTYDIHRDGSMFLENLTRDACAIPATLQLRPHLTKPGLSASIHTSQTSQAMPLPPPLAKPHRPREPRRRNCRRRMARRRPPARQPRRREAHNMVERRYRDSVNGELAGCGR
jgi:hypothetical protein